jgi:hypothetical protein
MRYITKYIYQIESQSWRHPLFVDFFISSITDKTFLMDLTADVVQETGTYTITFTSGFIRIFGQVRVVHLFNFMCCIYFCFVYLGSVSYAKCYLCLWIVHFCPFGFL